MLKQNTEQYLNGLELMNHEKGLLSCGKGFFHVFDNSTFQPKQISKSIKKGEIISCQAAPNPSMQNYENASSLIGLGKFDREIYLLDLKSDKIIYTINGHVNGITHLKFDPSNAYYLYSGARQDNLVYMWDLRNLSNYMKYFERESQTNQRMKFDITKNGQYIALGNTNGKMSLYDINSEKIVATIQEHQDSVNCISCLESTIISSSGSRQYDLQMYLKDIEISDSDTEIDDKIISQSQKSIFNFCFY